VATVEWAGDGVRLIDQVRLPGEEKYVICRTPGEVARAIRDIVVRGAPAIGVAAAYGTALAALAGRLAEGAAEIRAAGARPPPAGGGGGRAARISAAPSARRPARAASAVP
jgi:methylthioribose-1-phosphate isomerase